MLGRIGDYMMFLLTLVVVITSVSSGILSISSVIIYDIYQGYISPFQFDQSLSTGYDRRKLDAQNYMPYNRTCMRLKHGVVIVVAALMFPLTLVLLAIGVDLPWLFQFMGIIGGSSVIPVMLAISWHRTTGSGVTVGVLTGLVSALAAWLGYASYLPNGLAWFQGNTGEQMASIVGLSVALGVGGVACVVVSLSCGGCDPDREEGDVWEACYRIDNPIVPWTMRYAPQIHVNRKDRWMTGSHLPPAFHVRRAFKVAELSAYIVGVGLSLVVMLVWPAFMLFAKVFSLAVFTNWAMLVLVSGALVAAYIVVVPLVCEVVQVCRGAYSIRAWKYREGKGNKTSDDRSSGVRSICGRLNRDTVQNIYTPDCRVNCEYRISPFF